MSSIIEYILENAEKGATGVFLGLFLLMLYLLRRDSQDHRGEYKEVVKEMFDIVNKNTESNTKLSESISNLKERL